jgi:hypothetical protein
MEKWRGPESPPETARRSDATDEPVAKVVQTGEPPSKHFIINNLPSRPTRSIELPQRKFLICNDRSPDAERSPETGESFRILRPIRSLKG